jgi:hypothetical protein
VGFETISGDAALQLENVVTVHGVMFLKRRYYLECGDSSPL